MSYLGQNINFAGNTAIQFRYENFAGDRGTPLVGESWFDTTGNRLRISKNGSTLATVRDTSVTIVNADIDAAAAIALSKLAVDPLARANHTGTQLAATISNFDTQVRTSRLDQMAAPTAAVSFNTQQLTNVGGAVAIAEWAVTAAASSNVLAARRTGDAVYRFRIDTDGVHYWTDGVSTVNAIIRNNGGILESRNGIDSAYQVFRVGDAVGNDDAVTLRQLQVAQNNQDPKASVLVATTGAESFTIAGGAVTAVTGLTSGQIDGYALANGERFLIKNAPAATGAGTGGAAGSTQPGNGFYTVVSGAGGASLTVARATDADGNSEVTPGASTWVERGSANAQKEYTLAVTGPITLNTTALAFIVTGSAIVGDPELIAIAALTSAADQLPYFTGSGTAALAAFGAAARNLLAATSAAQQRGVIAAGSAFTLLTGDGVATSWTITGATHGLGTSYLGVTVLENLSGTIWTKIEPDFTVDSSNNNALISLGHAPATNKLKIILHGGS